MTTKVTTTTTMITLITLRDISAKFSLVISILYVSVLASNVAANDS